MKNKIFQVCAGVAIVLFSTGFFIRSFNNAQASQPTLNEFSQTGTTVIGKYQASLSTAMFPDGVQFCALVIDTETGKTAFYFRGGDEDWKLSTHQLPASPIGQK